MVGIAEISAGLGSLNALKGIVQSWDAARRTVITNEIKIDLLAKIIDAQGALLAAQQSEAANLARIDELEKEVVRYQEWGSERENYELAAIRGGAVAYMAKPDYRGTQPPHWLCAACYGSAKKSILQPQGAPKSTPGDVLWQCPTCKAALVTDFRNRPAWSDAA